MPRAKETEHRKIIYVQEARQEPKTNGLAIASFVLSLMGIFTFGVTTILGFILGIVAQYQIDKSGERGGGLATTAIVLGSILIAFFLIGWLVGIQI